MPRRRVLRPWLLAALLGVPLAAQGAAEPVWGLYASYAGVPPLWSDPCGVTYTISTVDNPVTAANVRMGLMVPIVQGVPRSVAQRRFEAHGRYFNDQPDGIVKLRSCGGGTGAPPPPPGTGWGGGAADPCGERGGDQVLTVAEAAGGQGGDPYQTARVQACVDPARTLWIAWNDRPDPAALSGSRPGQVLLGPGGMGTDDFIDVTVTAPSGRAQTVRMDQNDTFGASSGPQNVLFGRRGAAPAVYRRTPFGPGAGREQFLDEEGAFNGLFTEAGAYTFEFRFRDNTGGRAGHGHGRVLLLVKTFGAPAFTPPLPVETPPVRPPALAGIQPRHGARYRVRFRGQVLDTLYERGSDQGMPIDLYYWPVLGPDGTHLVQDGERLWHRIGRKPAVDAGGPAPAWFHFHWTWQGGRWVGATTWGQPFEVLEELR
jgi:hypothetical protein